MSTPFLNEEVNEPVAEGRQWWYAEIASNPASFDERVNVMIPEFSRDIIFEFCFWQSRGSNLTWEFTTEYGDTTTGDPLRPHDVLPKVGDRCLVIFDNRRQPWVVAWWPYSG